MDSKMNRKQKFPNNLNSEDLIIMKDHEVRKNCQTFIAKLQNTEIYDSVKQFVLSWNKQEDKEKVPAFIKTFMNISKVVHATPKNKDDRLIENFNRCLVKEATVIRKPVAQESLQVTAMENLNANKILDKVQWIKKETKPIEKPVPLKQTPIPLSQQIKQSTLMSRLQNQPQFRDIIKVLHLYHKSIISFEQVRNLLVPIYALDPSLYIMLVQACEEIVQKRRKATIFASLNELIDKKYPTHRVGESYILIPDGYANYSGMWKHNPLESIMNRKCVSVPLGSEVSFVISKKTDYEQQLFSYEDQRYQIDTTLCYMKAAIDILSSATINPRKLESGLVQRVVNELYPNQNVSSILTRNLKLARNVVLPRIIEKRDELWRAREKFVKLCEDVAGKNFYKSLDYRCYYFVKNDKKFNCPSRWEKEIDMRRTQILENQDVIEEELIEDRESLQRGRFFYVNSFDNITKQNLIHNHQTKFTFQHKKNSTYPKYPDNQILFILNFSNVEILNDVLQIILYFCHRKSLLQLLIFKLMRTGIKRKLKKSALLHYLLDTKDKIVNNLEVSELFSNLKNPSFVAPLEAQAILHREETLLNDSKQSRNLKESEEEFNLLIEEEEDPTFIRNDRSPFEGPQDGYTIIATKQVYMFLRYLTAIYQRFLKAKEYSKQMEIAVEIDLDMYHLFLTALCKIKEKKNFEENMRKIFCKNAFIFFHLQKMISSAVKIISSIAADSLTFQIIKDNTRDYEMGAFHWDKYSFPTISMQLTRLYLEKETLFRFTFEPDEHNCYISAWNPPFQGLFTICSHNQELSMIMEDYTTRPIRNHKDYEGRKRCEEAYRAEEVAREQAGKLLLRGELVMACKWPIDWKKKKQLKMDVKKLKQMQKYL